MVMDGRDQMHLKSGNGSSFEWSLFHSRRKTVSEKNKQIYQELYDKFWTGGDADVLADYMDDGYVDHIFGHKSVEDWVSAMAPLRTGMSDLTYNVDLMIAEGDLVSSLWTATATHSGEFMGMPPTGKRITFTGNCTARFRDGKLIEEWSHPDIFELMKQVGAIPETATA